MSKQQKTTKLVRHILVQDADGNRHTIEEWGDFIRVQYHDDEWSDWTRSGGRLKLQGRSINPTDNPAVFELAATGEQFIEVPER